jgi:geranylgeranyl diphosphate synthase type I
MVEKKSGALFGCALELGALSADADVSAQRRFREAGRELGLAFQARDDILAIWGDEAKTGKPAASDIVRGKKSLPFVIAAAVADENARESLASAYSDGDVPGVLALFGSLDVRSACDAQAEVTKQNALKSLDALTLDADTGSELKRAAEFLIDRDF